MDKVNEIGMSAMARATLASFVLLFSDFPSGASASFYGPGGPQRRGASRTPPALPLLADRHSQLQQQEEEARRAAPRHLQRRRERERGRERGPLRNRRRQARRKGRKRRRQVEEEESREYSACETLEGEEGQCKPLVLCAGRNVEDARENKCLIRSAEEDKVRKGGGKKIITVKSRTGTLCTMCYRRCTGSAAVVEQFHQQRPTSGPTWGGEAE